MHNLGFFVRMSVWRQIMEDKYSGKKSLAVLLDPDKLGDKDRRKKILKLINECRADYIFVGGSLVVEDRFEEVIKDIKANTELPVILFPGSVSQVNGHVDAILFLSLISGRNPELLIGQHVIAAPKIKQLQLETISTGYMLVDCGKATTASYISGTLPLPYDKPEIAAATASAGEMIGMSCMYLDGGSGAAKPVSQAMIHAVRMATKTPIIVGGGIRSEEEAAEAWNAGADIIVMGTAFEEDPELLIDIASLKASD